MPYSPEIERYRTMQKGYYESANPEDDGSLVNIVGCFDVHERYPYERFLLEHINPHDKVALDFGCGPGRMIRRMARFFKRVDGVDISQPLIQGAARWCKDIVPQPNLYVNDGVTLADVPSGDYDFVYSTIAFHHIARHDIRMSLLREFHRVLREGGRLCLQMFYTTQPRSEWMHHADWRDDPSDVPTTNGHHDVRITSDNLWQVRDDFTSVGLLGFTYTMAPYPPPPHPVESATDWVFLHARKP